jgi:hypothetical protein
MRIANGNIDLILSIVLTLFGVIPGIVHGFYVLFVYYKHRQLALRGGPPPPPAPGIFSTRVQSGGYRSQRSADPASAGSPTTAYQ